MSKQLTTIAPMGQITCNTPTSWCGTSTLSATTYQVPPDPRDAYMGLNFLLVCIGLSFLILAATVALRSGEKPRRR